MKQGDIVTIYNSTNSGEEIVEGEAKLIKPSEMDNDGLENGFEWWQVEFIDELGTYYDRIVATY